MGDIQPTWVSPEDSVVLYQGDCYEIVPLLERGCVDAVITDPPYDGLDLPYDIMGLAKGNVVAFCKPENQFFAADEYLFWIKTPSTKNYKKACGRFVEMILIKRGLKSPFNMLHWSQMTGVYDDRFIYPTIHPYEKPLALIERLVRIYTNFGDLVFDPFMGSGSTGVACIELGRRFIGIEREEEYFRLAKNRIEDYIGEHN